MERLSRRTYAAVVLAAGAIGWGSTARGELSSDLKIPVIQLDELSSIHEIKLLSAGAPTFTSLPLNSPPINGFAPQVVFGITDEQAPNDFNFASHKASSEGGHTLPVGQSQYFTTAVFDTGSQSHLISFNDAQHFDFDDANRTGDSTADIAGASGTETTDVTDAVGVYATGFNNASVAGGTTLSVNPGSLVGQWNTSVLTAESGSSLPNLIGAPMAAQYQTVISNTKPLHLSVNNQTLRSPQVNFQTLSTALPSGYSKLSLSVQSVNGVTHDPVFFPSLEDFENVADNPSTPSFFASLFAKTTVSHTGGSLSQQDFVFDTGAQVSIISEDTAAQIGIFDGGENPTPPDFTVEVSGVGGTTTEVPGFYINSLNVVTNGGPITWTHVPVLLLNVLDPRTGSGFVPGILGMNLFGDRDLIVNADTNNPFVGLSPQWAWAATNGGSWSNAANWKLVLPNGIDTQANFLTPTGATGPQTVTVDGGGFTVGTLAFDNVNRYTINGPGTITMQVSVDQAQINVSTGNHTINAPMTLLNDTDVTVSLASSTLTISSDVNAGTNAVIKDGLGTLEMKNVRAGGLSVNGGTVFITANGTSTGASRITTLSIGGGSILTGKLDLNNNAMAIDNTGTLNTAATDVRTWLASGFASGSWNGNGIMSSAAATVAANSGNIHKTAIGFALASSIGSPATWFGQGVNPTSILMRYTIDGDADLNGQVGMTDFNALAANFGTGGKFWWQGDMNYDGVVNVLDLNAIATNWGQAAPAPIALGALVPEPGSMLCVGLIPLLFRRRR